jgi:ubiquinone/menaquinone biosynthesis C-methylase UbiE
MVEKYVLNIGSGKRTYKEYPDGSGFKCINYDCRIIDGCTNFIGDVRFLPFKNNSFDYILASDIIEHFPISQTDLILYEWRRVLKPGCTIEFRIPDLYAICSKYVKGEHDAKLTSWLLYGGQDYVGNFHFVAFDRKWFAEILIDNGFNNIFTAESDNNFDVKAVKL